MRLFVILIALSVAAAALADVVVLKDGTRLEGDVKKTAGGWQITFPDGKVHEILAENVRAIELGATSTRSTTQAVSANLASLRRSVENIADINQVIERYHRFIEQNKDSPTAADAEKDLAVWEERQSRGLVKLGTRWVTVDERRALADKAFALADQARELVARGRLHDAEPNLSQALELDPQNPPALYLRGVIQYQQTQLPAARKSFEAVNAVLNDHAPTLNNLGVILWRQNAPIAALNYFDQSIVAAPINKELLDNVAEALAGIPEDQRRNPVVNRVLRRFTEQDTRLSEMMAAQGWYRWGSTWIDRTTLERLQKDEKEVKDKL
ncbi:MAG: tetratricopeptide repeat protein, partial [Tepidisphaeraceae bacterium]